MYSNTLTFNKRYYEYLLTYVDDLFAISHDPDPILLELQKNFKFKNDKISEPEHYLNAKLKNKKMSSKSVWAISCLDCMKAAISNVKEECKNMKWKLPNK